MTRRLRRSGAGRTARAKRRSGKKVRLPVLGDAEIAQAIAGQCGALIMEGAHPHRCVREHGHRGLHASDDYYVWGLLSPERIGLGEGDA